MSKLAHQWIDIFAAGDHGANKGGVFTESDLDDIVRNFDPSFHEPPLVIGHPEDDSPAFGWVGALRREGGKLQMMTKDTVSPQFEEAVRARKFPKRSVSLYKTAKGWMLRHVGFLGGQIPEIKGLADIKFADEDTRSVAIDFEESAMAADEKTMMDQLRALFSELFGEKKSQQQQAAGANFSEDQVRELVTKAVTEAVKPLNEKLQAQEAKFAESARAAVSADVKTRAANAIAKLKASGKWVPAFDAIGVPVLFGELAAKPEVVEFGEADKDGKKKSASPLDIFVAFMEQHKAIVPTSAVYTGQQSQQTVTPKNVNPGRVGVDETSVRFDEAIQAKMKSDNKLTYSEAMTIVASEQPELTVYGGASAGAV